MVIGGSKKKPSFPKVLLLFQIIEITEAQKIHQNPISIFYDFTMVGPFFSVPSYEKHDQDFSTDNT